MTGGSFEGGKVFLKKNYEGTPNRPGKERGKVTKKVWGGAFRDRFKTHSNAKGNGTSPTKTGKGYGGL